MRAPRDPLAPCAEALWAGTLALMTAHAQHRGDAVGCPRVLIARKITSNLTTLATHPTLSVPLRGVVRKALVAWDRLASDDAGLHDGAGGTGSAGGDAEPPQGAWH